MRTIMIHMHTHVQYTHVYTGPCISKVVDLHANGYTYIDAYIIQRDRDCAPQSVVIANFLFIAISNACIIIISGTSTSILSTTQGYTHASTQKSMNIIELSSHEPAVHNLRVHQTISTPEK